MFPIGCVMVTREACASIRNRKSLEALSFESIGGLDSGFLLPVDTDSTPLVTLFPPFLSLRGNLNSLALPNSPWNPVVSTTAGGPPPGVVKLKLEGCDEDRDPTPPPSYRKTDDPVIPAINKGLSV